MKKAIICDIDGTLAIRGDRDVYDFSKCGSDFLNMPVAEVLQMFCRFYPIFIVTGRDSAYREITLKWLAKYKIPFNGLYMRPAGDNRKDTEVKKEIYENHIQSSYRVLFVLDDRDRVVELWRKELGLSCFQVQYGDF